MIPLEQVDRAAIVRKPRASGDDPSPANGGAVLEE